MDLQTLVDEGIPLDYEVVTTNPVQDLPHPKYRGKNRHLMLAENLPWEDFDGNGGSMIQVVSGDYYNMITHSNDQSLASSPLEAGASHFDAKPRKRKRSSSKPHNEISSHKSALMKQAKLALSRWNQEENDQSESRVDSAVSLSMNDMRLAWKIRDHSSANEGEGSSMDVNETLLLALQVLKFSTPTTIQKASLFPAVVQRNDIIMAAPTGSGKTLAYTVPILQQMYTFGLVTEDYLSHIASPLVLILCPTRELALQVHKVVQSLCFNCSTLLRSMVLVGGMAKQKQERLLSRKPAIVVATPGRLWELIRGADPFLRNLGDNLKWLVVDEADRMVEQKHFKELDYIMSSISQREKEKQGHKNLKKRQSIICSATVTSHLDMVAQRIPFLSKVVRIDASTKQLTVSQLKESKIATLTEEKDIYLLYLIWKVVADRRGIVFVNSIATLKMLVEILKLLRIPVHSLHANKQQKQRIKALEKFTKDGGILVASDVAARGLDIPLVDVVIHYQLPHTTELYVHRSGRTARAGQEGQSVILLGPSDTSKFSNLLSSLHKDTADIPSLPVDYSYLKPIRERVKIAKELATLQKKYAEKENKKGWLKKLVEEADLDISEDEVLSSDDEIDGKGGRRGHPKNLQLRIGQLSASLKNALEQPLIPRGSSRNFVTRTNL